MTHPLENFNQPGSISIPLTPSRQPVTTTEKITVTREKYDSNGKLIEKTVETRETTRPIDYPRRFATTTWQPDTSASVKQQLDLMDR